MKLATMLRTMAAGTLGTMLWALAPGCGPSVGAYCNKICDCTGCSDSELDDCVDAIDDARKDAEDEGCSGEFDAYLSCLDGELTCEDDKVEADGCDSEGEKLVECAPQIGGIGKNACDAYADKVIAKYESCGVTIEGGVGGGETECSDAQASQAACLAPCVDITPCECVDPDRIAAGECTQEIAQGASDCVVTCSG